MNRYDHMATAQMELSLAALARWARAYAATGPKSVEDQLHQVIDELLDEHRRRRSPGTGSLSSPESPNRS